VRKAVDKLPPNWAEGGANVGLTKDLLVLLRERKYGDACELAVTQLIEGKAKAGAVWDAIHLAAGEMVMCNLKNSTPLHSNTSANALHYIFQASTDKSNRLLALFQAIGFICLYRSSMADKNWLKEAKQINEIEAAKISDNPNEAVEEILAHLSFGPGGKPSPDPFQGGKGSDYFCPPWRYEAATKVFAFAQKFGAGKIIHEAFRLLPVKADFDAHRIKFPIAAWENCGWVSPEWWPHMVAAASYSFLGADALDTDVAKQVREAMGMM
jgi:hypothetical protein